MALEAFYVTQAGQALLARAQTGETLTFTRAQAGKGTWPAGTTPASLTQLVDPVTYLTISKATSSENQTTLTVQFTNSGVEEAWNWSEFAVWAADPDYPSDRSHDILYGVSYADGQPVPIPEALTEFVFRVILTTGGAQTIQVLIDSSLVYMTQEDAVALIQQETADFQTETDVDEAIENHNTDGDAHKNKQDLIKVVGLLKGTKTTTEESETYSVGAATPGADYQEPTNTLTAAESMTTQDLIPFYDATAGQHKRATLQKLKEAIGVQSPTISVTTCAGASVTCTDGVTTLQGTGSTDFELTHMGDWTVTASLGGQSASQIVEVKGGILYEVDLMITSGIAVTTQPTKTTYYIGEPFDSTGMVVTATFADNTTANVTADCEFSPQTMAEGTQSVTVTYERVGIQKNTSVTVSVRVLDHIAVTTGPIKTNYKHGETFNPAGMVVTAYYNDSQSRAVSNYTYSPTGGLSAGTTSITISYSEGSVTKTTTQAITVTKVLTSISVTAQPNKLNYLVGQLFNPAGMVVTAYYNNGSSAAVSNYTYSPTGALSAGNTSITISYSEGGVIKTTTQAITVITVSTTLNSNSWSTIRLVSDANQGLNYWDVGDTKSIIINGQVGNTYFSSLLIDVYIVGFNHNATFEGQNKIHFKIGKIGGIQVSLCDTAYWTDQSGSGYFNMNPNAKNSGGWDNCHMRNTILGSDATPTSPRANTLLAALPADLRAIMKPITKYSDNTGGSKDVASYVTSTTDYLPLPSEFEIQGTRTLANSAEQNYQSQYTYYQAGNSKIHYNHRSIGTAVRTWTRSVCGNYDNLWCLVSPEGNPGGVAPHGIFGVAPNFAA